MSDVQNIPECFIRKIHYDNEIDRMKREAVITLNEWQRVRTEQEHARYSCRKLISLNRSGSGAAA